MSVQGRGGGVGVEHKSSPKGEYAQCCALTLLDPATWLDMERGVRGARETRDTARGCRRVNMSNRGATSKGGSSGASWMSDTGTVVSRVAMKIKGSPEGTIEGLREA